MTRLYHWLRRVRAVRLPLGAFVNAWGVRWQSWADGGEE